MGTSAPKPVADLVKRFSRARKVFLSSGYKEEQLRKARTPHEQESLPRQITATDKQIDALVHELYELTEDQIQIVEKEV